MANLVGSDAEGLGGPREAGTRPPAPARGRKADLLLLRLGLAEGGAQRELPRLQEAPRRARLEAPAGQEVRRAILGWSLGVIPTGGRWS